MAEVTPYFHSITDARAMLLSEEQQLAGATTISLETQSDLTEEDITSFLHDHFDRFLEKVHYLRPNDQELLLSYYLLSKPQQLLAELHGSTQTMCSSRLRMAVRTLGTFLMTDGQPSEKMLHRVLEKAGLEHTLEVPLSHVVMEYVKVRNFTTVADRFGLHRPDIRRAMSRATKVLMDSDDGQEAAIAAWLHSLIDKVSPVKVPAKRKAQRIVRTDPAILGEFRLNVSDPDFSQMFSGRANR